MTTNTEPRGIRHRHEDGTEHEHHRAGFTIGRQVIPDADGTEEHRHGTMTLDDASGTTWSSGYVVWRETDVETNREETNR